MRYNEAMNFRKAGGQDIEKIEQTFALSCFGDRKPDWNRVIGDEKSIMLIAEDGGQIVGFTGMEWQGWKNAFELINVFVSPAHRGKGLGSALIDQLIEIAKKRDARAILAHAIEDSLIIKLFEKMGFNACGYHDKWLDNTGKQKMLFFALPLI